MSESVREFFELTENYLRKNFGVGIRRKILEDLIGSVSGMEILDAGCGDGSISEPFWEKNNVVLFDLSSAMIKLVQQKSLANSTSITVLNGDIESFRFDQKFDIIFAIGLLAHVNSVEGILKRFFELLNPSGKLIIQFSNYENLVNKIRVRLQGGRKYKLNTITAEYIRQFANKNKLSEVSEVKYGLMIPGLGRLKNEQLYKLNLWTYRNQSFGYFYTERILVLEKK